MNLNYDFILTDLKKAKSTILSLRQERDLLKDTCLELEQINKNLKKKLEIGQQECNVLKERLNYSKFEHLSNNLISKYSEISKEVEKIFKKKQTQLFFPDKKIIESLESGKFTLTIKILTEFLYEFVKKNSEIEENSMRFEALEEKRRARLMSCETFGEIEGSEFCRLINESCSLLDTLDKQNSRISTISKNITKVVQNEQGHKSSRSLANIKLSEY